MRRVPFAATSKLTPLTFAEDASTFCGGSPPVFADHPPTSYVPVGTNRVKLRSRPFPFRCRPCASRPARADLHARYARSAARHASADRFQITRVNFKDDHRIRPADRCCLRSKRPERRGKSFNDIRPRRKVERARSG